MQTLVECVALHLADCRYRNLSPKTLQLYEMYEKTFLAFLDARGLDRGVSALNAANVKDAALWLKDKHRGKRGGESAVRTFVATLKILSRFLMDEDVIAYDYLAKVRRPKVTTPVRKPFEPWEIQAIRGALLETRTAHRDVAILSLLLDTGLRISELCALSLRDVDLRAYTVRVMGKGRVERIVPFGDASRSGGKTAGRLREYLGERKPQVASERFFLSYDGYPFTAAGFRQAFLGACRRAGVANTSVHTTRHTFATRFLVAHPGDIEQLRFLLGHMSDDTYRIYVRQAGEILAETSERFSIAADLERVHVAM